jgi:acetyl esterase
MLLRVNNDASPADALATTWPSLCLDANNPTRESEGKNTAMPVDPQIQALLDLRAKLPPLHTLSVADARLQMAARDIPGLRKPDVGPVIERDMQGPGGSLPLRVYTPRGEGPFPLMVFFHGSGFVLCSLDTHDAMCRNLCAGAGCVVVSVDYRLAPEHNFPAASDDCLAATQWVADNAAALSGDAGRIMVAGDSAGGNLAAVTALRARDENGPRVIGQMLIYPVTDYFQPATRSMTENAEGYGLTRDGMIWFWNHYVHSAGDGVHPHAAPLRAATLAGLPPALVVTAQYDPLRDEGEHYAARLREHGVPVEMKRWDGMNHGFFFFPGIVDKATAAIDEACIWARRVFGE